MISSNPVHKPVTHNWPTTLEKAPHHDLPTQRSGAPDPAKPTATRPGSSGYRIAPMMTLATSKATAGISQTTGNRSGSVRQLVSAATVCRRPVNQPSAFLTALIRARATQKQPRAAARCTGSTIAVSLADPEVASTRAAPAQHAATAAVRQ